MPQFRHYTESPQITDDYYLCVVCVDVYALKLQRLMLVPGEAVDTRQVEHLARPATHQSIDLGAAEHQRARLDGAPLELFGLLE
jgi:hypothetical protein